MAPHKTNWIRIPIHISNHKKAGLPVEGDRLAMNQPLASPDLNSSVAALFGADSDRLLETYDEHLAVSDLSGLGSLHDGINRLGDEVVGDDDLKFNLREEIHRVFRTAVDFGVTLLASEALDLGNGHSLDADTGQGFLNLFEFEWFDDGYNEFHTELVIWDYVTNKSVKKIHSKFMLPD